MTNKNVDRVGNLADYYCKIELAQKVVHLEDLVEGYRKLHEQSLRMLKGLEK
tara:strand:+ start:82 stop:237 length:156 start_codon:yes stop_codon:yes gene_type:complete